MSVRNDKTPVDHRGESLRIRRQRAVAAARRDGVTVRQIAEALGTTSANVSSIVSRGSQYSPFALALDEWLVAHGYATDTMHEEPPCGHEPGTSSSADSPHCPLPTIDNYLQLLASAHAEGDHAAVGETLKIGAALARLMSELIELRSQMERVASRLERS
ncbi:MAG TPA: hypothetical protein PLF51_10640 [Candidatus Hydrogenedentes bacterium]|jgi:hypothetical protein|nr:hypothetical protein [Candidatus Hydrogenedentota bacterium]